MKNSSQDADRAQRRGAGLRRFRGGVSDTQDAREFDDFPEAVAGDHEAPELAWPHDAPALFLFLFLLFPKNFENARHAGFPFLENGRGDQFDEGL